MENVYHNNKKVGEYNGIYYVTDRNQNNIFKKIESPGIGISIKVLNSFPIIIKYIEVHYKNTTINTSEIRRIKVGKFKAKGKIYYDNDDEQMVCSMNHMDLVEKNGKWLPPIKSLGTMIRADGHITGKGKSLW